MIPIAECRAVTTKTQINQLIAVVQAFNTRLVVKVGFPMGLPTPRVRLRIEIRQFTVGANQIPDPLAIIQLSSITILCRKALITITYKCGDMRMVLCHMVATWGIIIRCQPTAHSTLGHQSTNIHLSSNINNEQVSIPRRTPYSRPRALFSRPRALFSHRRALHSPHPVKMSGLRL